MTRCTGLHLARGACRPASPVSGVHVPCLTDSPALARFRRAPMPRPLKLVVEGVKLPTTITSRRSSPRRSSPGHQVAIFGIEMYYSRQAIPC